MMKAHAVLVSGLLASGVLVATASAQPAEGQHNRAVASPDRPLGTGVWRYTVGGPSEFGTRCRGMDAPVSAFHLVIENESDETLECTASISLRGEDGRAPVSVVEPRARQLAAEVCTFDPERFTGASATCSVREVAPAWDVPPGCGYTVTKAEPVSSRYPASSRRLLEQGPVDVGFTLSEKDGRPVDVAVVQGAGSRRLDAAAIQYVQSMRMRTDCPGVRYRMKVRFRIGPDLEPVETGPVPVAMSRD
jgi:TonB family protein